MMHPLSPTRGCCTADPLADALRLQPHTDEPYAQLFAPRYREASVSAAYGSSSTLAQPLPAPRTATEPAGDALFQGFVLLLGVAFVLLIYHNLSDVRTLLNHLFRDHTSDKRSFQEPSGSRYTRLLRTAAAIGLLFLGIFAVKYSAPYLDALPLERIPFATLLLLSVAVSIAALLVAGCQWLALWTIGALTLTQPMLSQLRELRLRYFASAVVLVAPTLMLHVLMPEGQGFFWLVLTVIGLVVTLFLYLRETLTLFLAKKVSFIHWFLYLCTVEALPVALLWQLLSRSV